MLGLQSTAIASQKLLNMRPAKSTKTAPARRPVQAKASQPKTTKASGAKQQKQPQKQKDERPPTRLELALSLLAAPEDPARCGAATVRFNHYRKQFPVRNGVLLFEDIDREYAFSFVYRGQFVRFLRLDGAEEDLPSLQSSEDSNYFLGVDPNLSYRIFIEEDPKAGVGVDGLAIHEGPLKFVSRTGGDTSKEMRENRQVKEITETLKKMDVKNLHSAEAMQLLEARDLEDILYR